MFQCDPSGSEAIGEGQEGLIWIVEGSAIAPGETREMKRDTPLEMELQATGESTLDSTKLQRLNERTAAQQRNSATGPV